MILNWTTEVAIAVYVGTALISTMPPKDTKWDGQALYSWLYDCLHVMLNTRPTRGSNS